MNPIAFRNFSRCRALPGRLWTIFMLWAAMLSAGYCGQTVYMTVLNSRQHQWGKSQNPLVGLFVSQDSGHSWQHIGWREAVRIFHMDVGPDGTIWCAAGNGVLRSRDAGQSWKITTDWQITEVLKVRSVPTNPNTVYAASAYGVYKTTDAGDHWSKIRDGYASDLLINRQDPSMILSATEEGLFVSFNEGRFWDLFGLADKSVRVLAQSGKIFWAGTEDDGMFVLRSENNSWQRINKGLTDSTIYTIAVDPENEQQVFIGTHAGGVFASTDGGNNWVQRTNGLTNLTVHGLMYIPPHSLLAGTINGGLFESRDNGLTWKFNSQPDAQVWSLAIK
jgi:photosystem II stability/assembly factor-like uncharacterized protein